MSHDHSSDDSHDLPSDPALRVKALESLLVEKGFVDPAALDALVEAYETKIGPHVGARVVARAWTNLVVCTLCSCYPWSVLGLPPTWYKSAPYRSRAVIDPRGVLREFGVELPEETEIRVWDSTAELRYMVVPERPAGSEGLSEEALAALVTRDSMIGTALARAPAADEGAPA
jgi:nitrile hydratase